MEIVIVVVWLICAGFASFIASQKNRSSGGWLLLGLLFGIFALIAVAGVPALDEAPQEVVAVENAPSQAGERIIAVFGMLAVIATGAILFWWMTQ